MAPRSVHQRRNTRHAIKSRANTRKWDMAAIQRQSLRIAIQQSLDTSRVLSDSNPQNPGSGTEEDDDSPSISEHSDPGMGEVESTRQAELKNAPAQPDLSNGVPSGRPGWYGIRGIIAQKMRYYLVQWEGVDPATGNDWPLDFIHYSNLNGAALRAWHGMQQAGELKRDIWGIWTKEDAQISVDIEEAWQRSINQACTTL